MRDEVLKKLWHSGATLEKACLEFGKSPTSIAHKLVRMGLYTTREEVNEENYLRGGVVSSKLESDGQYTVYLIRSPITNVPIYVGQSQKYEHRKRIHVKRFTPMFGEPPLIEVICTVDTYLQARKLERHHIATHENAGIILFNIQDKEECNNNSSNEE